MVLKCTGFCGKYSIHCPVFFFSSPPCCHSPFYLFLLPLISLSASLWSCPPPPQDFLPLLRWQGDGLSPNKLVHLSIRASVEEVPAIMKLSGRLRLREWWREGEKDWIMAFCARDRERKQKCVAGVSRYAEETCSWTEHRELATAWCSDPWTTTHSLYPHVIASPAWILTQHCFLLICCFFSL